MESGGLSVTLLPDPTLYDTDGGGINDGFETLNPEYGLDPLDRTDDLADLDDDGLCNMDELLHGTELDNPDTDGDLVSDGAEVQWGTNPLVADNWDWESDTDGDGMTLEVEYATRSNPFDAQSIGDTLRCIRKRTDRKRGSGAVAALRPRSYGSPLRGRASFNWPL
ncbi:MAG: hypothetical protein JXR40_10965 [Pontiellaceae bacterium]|nr:hypothetical protein [Pontiellaceae bacterium]